jgi:hypothetical protein
VYSSIHPVAGTPPHKAMRPYQQRLKLMYKKNPKFYLGFFTYCNKLFKRKTF